MEIIVLHFTQVGGSGECIKIIDAEAFCEDDKEPPLGFKFENQHSGEIEGAGSLPLGYVLRRE